LGVAVVTETHGRERRHRYYVYEAYRALLEREKLDDAGGPYSSVDLSSAGNFFQVAPEQFYKSQDQLSNYQDSFREQENKHKAKKHKITNPILEDGTVKKGRPRKDQTQKKVPFVAREDKRKKRKQGEIEDLIDATDDRELSPTKRRKVGSLTGVRSEAEQTRPAPKKRGSPRKNPADSSEAKQIIVKRINLQQQRPSLSTSVDGSPAMENLDDSLLIGPDTSLSIFSNDNEIDPNLRDLPLQPRETQTEMPDTALVAEPLSTNASDVALPEISLLASVLPEDNAHVSTDSPVTQSILSQHLKLAVVEPARSPSEQASENMDTLTIPASVSEHIHQEQDKYRSTVSVSTVLAGHSLIPWTMPQEPATVSRIENPSKRLPDDAGAETSPAKRIRLSKPGLRKPNVSHLRRDNELFRVIQDFGGITVVNVKEFLDAHIALIETLTKSGEPTSAPIGTRLDRRTVDAAMQKLEGDCRIKVVKTSVCVATGATRPVTIAHLFDMEQERVNDFLSNLNSIAFSSGHVLSKPKMPDSDADHSNNAACPSSPVRVAQRDGVPDTDHVRRGKNPKRAAKFLSYDDATIHKILQRESATISQSYGYITGRVARARELHLVMLNHFRTDSNCPLMVSSDQRIVHRTYFLRDISISTYCKLLPISTRVEELDELLQDEEGRQTLLRDLAVSIYSGIGIEGSKSQARLLEILELLRALKLVTPLKPSQSATPEIMCANNGTHPAVFDIAPPEMLTSANKETIPVYWKFNVTAPIFLWALSDTTPLTWGDMPISSHADGLAYWNDLQRVCLDSKFVKSLQNSSHRNVTDVFEGDQAIGKPLRRPSSWRSSYILSWHQERYLRQFIDSSPLSDEDEGVARIKSMAWVISAPEQVVRQFYTESVERRTRELNKARIRAERGNVPAQATKGKASLAKKAAERKLQRQQEWDALVARLHPEPIKKPLASRLKRIRDEYMRATSVRESRKWELGIVEAIRGIKLATSKVLLPSGSASAVAPFVSSSNIPPTVVNSSEKSVDELIAQQGPHQSSDSAKKKGWKKNEDGSCLSVQCRLFDLFITAEESSQKKRRGRFTWTRDYDELAKDASAIIKARCRTGQRMEWAAAEQAFPSLPRNSVRQRVDRLSKEPGVEAYLRRLEDKWYELWIQHRGTQLLPDPEPSSVSGFDLVKHLKFLRAHVDKSSL
jgi:oxalate---CoA ligase